MTWGEIQIESLKKMFLNKEILKVEDLKIYKEDKKYKTYLDAMPQACNEAINYIINLEPIIKVIIKNVTAKLFTFEIELVALFTSFSLVITV